MQYGHRKLQRSVTEIRRSRSARPNASGRPGRPSNAGGGGDGSAGVDSMRGRGRATWVMRMSRATPWHAPSAAAVPAQVVHRPVPPGGPTGTSSDCTTAHPRRLWCTQAPDHPTAQGKYPTMATTDTRSGFRLPWSSDRSHEELDGADAAEAAPEPAARLSRAASPPTTDSRPDGDLESRRRASRPRRTAREPRPGARCDCADAGAGRQRAPAKPTKLMVDLAAAIRATDRAGPRPGARPGRGGRDAGGRSSFARGLDRGRRRAPPPFRRGRRRASRSGRRPRSPGSARRPRPGSATRKHLLERELAAHAAAIEDRVSAVESTVARYRGRDGRLLREPAPARRIPPAWPRWPRRCRSRPTLEAWTGHHDLTSAARATRGRRDGRGERARGRASPRPTEPEAIEPSAASAGAEADRAEAEAERRPGPTAERREPVGPTPARPAQREHCAARRSAGDSAARAHDGRWTAIADAGAPRRRRRRPAPAHDDGDPVDRDAIMAALEAAAEAVVAGPRRVRRPPGPPSGADAAGPCRRVDSTRRRPRCPPASTPATSTTASFADRLASLLPASAEGAAEGEPRTTQVVGDRPRVGREHRELQAPPRPAPRRPGRGRSPRAPTASSCST